ncbi:hypothetical protein [Roseovarius sp.]|uniref:8-oxoguanine DNA glycosylase n=1 Tax=Roseovarius sp. TaxID=1486281 RepID=UPI003A96BF26
MQEVFVRSPRGPQLVSLPSEENFVLPGIKWGSALDLFTPAYWRLQYIERQWNAELIKTRLGTNILEEAAACMLGGYGIPAELGLAAFEALRAKRLLTGKASQIQIYNVLSKPMFVGGKTRSYRFKKQKSVLLASALKQLRCMDLPENDRRARNELCNLPGVGPKTASWIIRNTRDSDKIAILDVHILRFGNWIDLFPRVNFSTSRYEEFEDHFLDFSDALNVPASQLDALIWDQVRAVSIQDLAVRDYSNSPHSTIRGSSYKTAA